MRSPRAPPEDPHWLCRALSDSTFSCRVLCGTHDVCVFDLGESEDSPNPPHCLPRRRYADCRRSAHDLLRRYEGEDGFTKIPAKKLRPFLQLRQACCHHQIGSRSLKSLGARQQPCTTRSTYTLSRQGA